MELSDWRDGYDDWKLRSPDWDDDPCAHVRAEYEAEMRELHEQISDLKSLVKVMLDNDPNEVISDAGHTMIELWRHDARNTLGLPDPNAPVEEEIVF